MQKTLLLTIYLIALGWSKTSYTSDILFNTDLLDVKDKENIDLGAFKKAGYIFPGEYTMQLVVNDTLKGERKVRFHAQHPNESKLCLTRELASELGLKKMSWRSF